MSESGFVNLSDLETSTKIFWNIDLKLSAFILIVIVLFIISSILRFIFTDYNEPFQNDHFYSYKNINYSNYASVPLTAINNEQNITFGQITRIISSDPNWEMSDILKTKKQDNKLYINLEVFANLYILGGQIYDENKPITQEYLVSLTDPKTNKTIILGKLHKDNDGLYRLKYKMALNDLHINLLDYNIVNVIYVASDSTGKELSNKVVIGGDLFN